MIIEGFLGERNVHLKKLVNKVNLKIRKIGLISRNYGRIPKHVSHN